jgi:hypothetical protein
MSMANAWQIYFYLARNASRAGRAAVAAASMVALAACSSGGGTGKVPAPNPGAPGAAPQRPVAEAPAGSHQPQPSSGDGQGGNGAGNDNHPPGGDAPCVNLARGATAPDRPCAKDSGRPAGEARAGDHDGDGESGAETPVSFTPAPATPVAAPQPPFQQGAAPAQQPAAPAQRPRVHLQGAGFEPHGLTPAQIFANAQGGAIAQYDNGGQVYSTAGAYDIYGVLQPAVVAYQGAAQFASNRGFAGRIGTSKVVTDDAAQEIELVVRMGADPAPFRLRGKLARYESGVGAAMAEVSGREGMRGFTQCLDADGRCSTVLTHMWNYARQSAYFITRGSPVYVYVEPPAHSGTSLARDRFVALFTRAVGMAADPSWSDRTKAVEWYDRLTDTKLFRTEVVGGRSTFLIEICALVSEPQYPPGSYEAVGFEGPLVKDASRAAASAWATSANAMAAYDSSASSRNALATSVRQAWIDRNNGRGAIGLALTFDNDARTAIEEAHLVFAAKQKAIAADPIL